MKLTLIVSSLSFMFVLILSGQFVWGQIPQTISYQGALTDTSGNAVPDGSYEFTFRMYDIANGGNPLWEELLYV